MRFIPIRFLSMADPLQLLVYRMALSILPRITRRQSGPDEPRFGPSMANQLTHCFPAQADSPNRIGGSKPAIISITRLQRLSFHR